MVRSSHQDHGGGKTASYLVWKVSPCSERKKIKKPRPGFVQNRGKSMSWLLRNYFKIGTQLGLIYDLHILNLLVLAANYLERCLLACRLKIDDIQIQKLEPFFLHDMDQRIYRTWLHLKVSKNKHQNILTHRKRTNDLLAR